MASERGLRDFEELKFVDRSENKIVTPEKEMISPTKEVIRPTSIQEDTQNKEPDNTLGTDVEVQEDNRENLKINIEKNLDETELDSGLDSPDYSENDKFIDRQEDIVTVDPPEKLNTSDSVNVFDPSKSTSKIVDELFNFINDENMGGDLEDHNENLDGNKITEDGDGNSGSEPVQWSLDAVNNNSEQIVQASTLELSTEPKHETEFVLSAKIEEPRIVEDNVHLVPESPDGASMNLYWYSNNIMLDPSEIQAFKNSQNDSENPDNQASTTGDVYYREKLEEPRLVTENQIPLTEDKRSSLHSDSVKSEKWSPIFESASTRFLDLASEMKGQPNDHNLAEDHQETAEKLEHPWGLETEEKHMSDTEDKQEELPEIEPKFHSLVGIPPVSKSDEVTDEHNDIKLSFQVKKNVTLKKFDKEISPEKVKDTEDSNSEMRSMDVENIDHPDATGYMELADKDAIIKLNSLNESEQIVGNIPVDQSDAVGLMELADKETVLAQTSVYTQLSQKDVKNVDNLRRKSEEKIVIEPILKSDTEELHAANQEPSLTSKSEADKQKADDSSSKVAVLNISDNLEKGIDMVPLDSIDMTDAGSPQVQAKLDITSEPDLLKAEAAPSLISKTILVKHEPVEIKRKFKVYDDSDKTVEKKGGKLLETEMFEDKYFDNSCYNLTLSDCWLRKRNSTFEFKTDSSSSGSETLSDEKAIIQSLQEMFHQKRSHETLLELLDELEFSEFASFQTTRKQFQLDDYTLTLELTDFGFQVGDVSLIVDNPVNISDSILRIGTIAKQLGELVSLYLRTT